MQDMLCNYKWVNQMLGSCYNSNIQTATSKECKSIKAWPLYCVIHGRLHSLYSFQSSYLLLPMDHAVSTHQLKTKHKLQFIVRSGSWETSCVHYILFTVKWNLQNKNIYQKQWFPIKYYRNEEHYLSNSGGLLRMYRNNYFGLHIPHVSNSEWQAFTAHLIKVKSLRHEGAW